MAGVDCFPEVGQVMAITHEDIGDSFRRITLSGRLDGPGTAEVDAKLAALSTAAKRRVVVDLTGVSFLASIGLRAVLSSAKAAQQSGGRMVLYVGANTAVTKTLEATGIDALIQTFADPAEAEKAALA
jgi:anti-anti-sigma factor